MIKEKDLARFCVEYGPKSLFDRVYYKMKDVHTLNLRGNHFNVRCEERKIPEEVINKMINFNVNEWILKTADVRINRGKFYNSTWEYVFDGCKYWVTIGIGETVMTIVRKNSSGTEKCLTGGEFYNFVDCVNTKLMEEDCIVN